MTRTAKCLWAIATTIAIGVTSCGAPPTPGRKPHGSLTQADTTACTQQSEILPHGNGALLTNVGVRVVFWGQTVDPKVTHQIPGFYRDFVQSPYIDWLGSEYSLPGKTIGRGTLEGVFTITPGNINKRLTQADVETELSQQVTAGKVGGAPSTNTIFMIHFPSNYVISTGADETCHLENGAGAGNIGGFHASFGSIRYAVIADLTDCACLSPQIPCGPGATLDVETRTASHELIEAITDPDPDGTTGWIDSSGCEIADLCDNGSYTRLHFPGLPDRSFLVARAWSNANFQADPSARSQACIVQKTPATSALLSRFSGQTPHGQLAVWPNASTNPPPWSPAIVSDDGWQIAGLGDYDGDLRSDILLRAVGSANQGLLQIWHDGNPSSSVSPGRQTDALWQISGTGDFDGDGLSDILWRYFGSPNTGQVAIWPNANPNAAFNPGVVLSTTWQILGNGDFDADGRSDILWRNTSTNALLTWPGGFPVSGLPSNQGPDSSWTFQFLGDFNGDGQSDIVWRSTTGQMVIWFSGTGAQTSTPKLMDPAWQIRSVGDYNGDGFSDILWRYTGPTGQTTHGQLQIWFSGADTTVFNSGVISDDGVQIQASGAFDPFVQQACIGKCGLVTIESGVQVDCGGCTAPQTCGGGGVANVCGCTRVPNPCKSNQCSGSYPDGCGGVYVCHADCGVNGLCPCRGGTCSAGFCACYTGTCN